MGRLKFSAGYYCYIGSALNGRLYNRVKRHISRVSTKKKHWHIDFLLDFPDIKVIKVILVPSPVREECKLAKTIKKLSINEVIGFGSSDCNCNSHLYYFGTDEPFN